MLNQEISLPCDDCVNPDACLTRCLVNEVIEEDIAAIRGENE